MELVALGECFWAPVKADGISQLISGSGSDILASVLAGVLADAAVAEG